MAYPPLSLLALATLVVVVASLSVHPSSAQFIFMCSQTFYGSQCVQDNDVDLPPLAVITIDLATNQTAPYGVKACPELPDNATLADVSAAYRKCAANYQRLQENGLQARKYKDSSPSNMVHSKDIQPSCMFQVQGTNCWEMH